LLAVSGLGCGVILGQEAGLHVLESVDDESDGRRTVDRIAALVQVASWPPGPAVGADELVRAARAVLDRQPAAPAIVRRYRPQLPDQLVRDAIRGYRTGRVDRVFAGDFDLFS
jgi:ATP-dependent Clp protease ATP-binding subunit ClpC